MAKYLSENDAAKVRRYINTKRDIKTLRSTDSPIVPPAELAKPQDALQPLELGTFTMQKNKPDATAPGARERDAYALRAIAKDELSVLTYFVGEDSQGYWAAIPVDSGCESCDGGSCTCEIIDTLEANKLITGAQAIALRQACGCGCTNCSGGAGPLNFEFTITGTTVDPIHAANQDYVDLAAWLNDTHTDILNAAGGTGCRWDKEVIAPVTSGNDFTVVFIVELRDDMVTPFLGVSISRNVPLYEQEAYYSDLTIPFDCYGSTNHTPTYRPGPAFGTADPFNGMQIQCDPDSPPPPPPPTVVYQYNTKALLEAADISLYATGQQVEVTADGSNDGFYIAVGQTGSTPSHWQFLSPPPP